MQLQGKAYPSQTHAQASPIRCEHCRVVYGLHAQQMQWPNQCLYVIFLAVLLAAKSPGWLRPAEIPGLANRHWTDTGQGRQGRQGKNGFPAEGCRASPQLLPSISTADLALFCRRRSLFPFCHHHSHHHPAWPCQFTERTNHHKGGVSTHPFPSPSLSARPLRKTEKRRSSKRFLFRGRPAMPSTLCRFAHSRTANDQSCP